LLAVHPTSALMAAANVNVDRLRREMLLRGWDGVDLAFHAGVSPATVSHAINGRAVSPTTLRKLAKALVGAPVVAGAEELLA
jgi:transcriptional regulator with XRE-family HTH domain